jgi:hypothetical protein
MSTGAETVFGCARPTATSRPSTSERISSASLEAGRAAKGLEPGVTRLYRALLAVLVSTALTVGAFRLGQIAPDLAGAVLWPAMLLVKAAGNGLNLGTPDHPAYEWTPVHDIAVGLGLFLSGFVYVMLFYAILGGLTRVRREAATW